MEYLEYLDRPLVVELAQLALDAYNSPKDDNLREHEFNPLWIRKDEWPRKHDRDRRTQIIPVNGYVSAHGPVHLKYNQTSQVDYDAHTGFYAAFYEHMITNVGVFVIRGTDLSAYLDLFEDIDYVFNKVMDQYEEAKSFWSMIEDYYLTSGLRKIYVCGHSLGGIIAKMIAPITGRDTVAFNSPGVKEYLLKNHLPCYLNSGAATNLPFNKDYFMVQRVVTYCAKADSIGNLRHDNDFEPYNFVDVLGGKQIPEEDDRLNNTVYIKDSLIERYSKHKIRLHSPLKYHSINDLYSALKNSEYQHDAI